MMARAIGIVILMVIAEGIALLPAIVWGSDMRPVSQNLQNKASGLPSSTVEEHVFVKMGATTMAIGVLSNAFSGFMVKEMLLQVSDAYNGDEYNDRIRNTWVGISLFIYPTIGIIAASSMAHRSRVFDYSFGAIVLSTYLGACIAFSASVLFSVSNNPEVDGKYDGGYFHDSRQKMKTFGRLFFHFILPSVLPGLGMMIAARVTRKPKSENKISKWLPLPIVLHLPDEKGNSRRAPGLLISAAF